MEKDEVWGAESDGIMVRREGELIQYSRRFKSKPGDSAAASKIFEHPAKHMHNEVSVTNLEVQMKAVRIMRKTMPKNLLVHSPLLLKVLKILKYRERIKLQRKSA